MFLNQAGKKYIFPFSCQFTAPCAARPGYWLGIEKPAMVLGFIGVVSAKQLRQTDDIFSLTGGLADPADGQFKIVIGLELQDS